MTSAEKIYAYCIAKHLAERALRIALHTIYDVELKSLLDAYNIADEKTMKESINQLKFEFQTK